MSHRLEGPRIYNLFPTLLGPVEHWEAHLPRIAQMGFNWIFLNPFHEPGVSGSLYSIKDYYRVHPLVRGGLTDEEAHRGLARFNRRADELGIQVMLDLVINHTAFDSVLVGRHPQWYARNDRGEVVAPYAVDPDDPEKRTVWGDLATLDYSPRSERESLLAYWDELLAHYLRLGFRGFRGDAAYKIPGRVWQHLIRGARERDGAACFFAETLGAQLHEVDQLRPAGFDYFFNSAKWWDFRAAWLLEQYEQFRHVAPSIAFAESHDTPRLAASFDGSARESRFGYLYSALFSTGVMMPIGYEFGFRRPLHVVETVPGHWEAPAFDISGFIGETNRMKAETDALNQEGPQSVITGIDEPVVGLLRRCEQDDQRLVSLINPDPEVGQDFSAERLAEALGCDWAAIREITPAGGDGAGAHDEGGRVALAPRSIRVFCAD